MSKFMESTLGILASDREQQLTAALTTFGNSGQLNFFTASSQFNGSIPTHGFNTANLKAIAIGEQGQIADFLVSQSSDILSYSANDRAASSTSLAQQQPKSDAMTAGTDPLTGTRRANQLNLSDPGNSLATARNIGVVDNSSVNLSDFVGVGDIDDYYSFTVSSNSNLSLRLDGLSANVGIELIEDKNRNGRAEPDEIIDRISTLVSTSREINFFNLTPGNYYVGVYSYSGYKNYNLDLTATPATGFSSNYGYGLVDANAAVARTFNSPVKFPEVPNLGGNDWTRDMVNAPEVWQGGITGNGIVVAVVDSGVDYNHLDLDANIWQNADEIPNNQIDDDRNGYVDDIRGWDFALNDNNPMDWLGHGTHVAGAIAAERNGFHITGVAPNAKIMPVKVSDRYNSNINSIAEGIRYAANNGANVINISLGDYRLSSKVIEDAVQYANSKGSVVVMSAGNDYSSQPDYPARNADRFGIAVGGIDRNSKMADFSNRAGSKPLDYIVAPGVDVVSTTPYNTYNKKTGTSMAAPHVAGVAALVLNANPNLTPAQVEEILTSTANANEIIA
ncbi:S8 family serine peptidase [Microcoleus vaginatus GB1-A2]|uniref:S8 family serine peptidase n=1 Tax=Microcoleus vaginatus TaxID=119532 RepID=UPI0016873C2A|nr:S8 family serine peptidase [Microcoleus sp. FACHB-61]